MKENQPQSEFKGINTGLKQLNTVTGGWQKGDLVLLASRPKMGKTRMMIFFAKTAAVEGFPVCVYSIESNKEAITKLLMLSFSNLSDSSELPIHIDDTAVVSMDYIREQSREMKKQGKCSIIFVDYLQLVDLGVNYITEEQRFTEELKQAKTISTELNVPLVLLSQLSRRCELKGDPRPILTDLPEYQGEEAGADIAAFLYRPEYYGFHKDESGKSLEGYGEIIIAKNLHGPIQNVPYKYNKSMTKLSDY